MPNENSDGSLPVATQEQIPDDEEKETAEAENKYVDEIISTDLGKVMDRIFNETKNRPLYLVDEYNGEKEMNN